MRSHEFVTLKMAIRSALDSSKEGILKKTTRRRLAPIFSSSSDSSQNDNQRNKRAKKKTPHRSAATSTSYVSAIALISEPLAWLQQVKLKLSMICDLVRIVPVEIRLLKQLFFESIDSREHSIHEAEVGTFRWMLNEPVDIGLPSHMAVARQSLIAWLNSGSGIFHISGRAGAGKSTLMKFLGHHPRTKVELEQWAGEKKLVFSCFYFWNSGSPMQMSLEGLYRSILLSVSRQCPDLMPSLFPDQWAAFSTILGGPEAEKSVFCPELIEDAFSRLLQQEDDMKYRMCFLIDGLDEHTGDNIDYWALAKSLRSWGEKSGVKLCVSARPYTEFLEIFSPKLRLHLHELTSEDISAFTRKMFDQVEQFTLSKDSSDQLADTIVEKSEGVFLWARVVVRSLLSLAKHGATGEQLLQCIDAYPTDVEGLFDYMLRSIGSHEQLRSNQMLLLAARNPFAQPLNALWFTWIDELDEPDFPVVNRPYSAAEVKKRHESVRSHLEWLTKGLLEMHTDRRERKEGDQFYRQRIQFFHRTARDYVQSPGRLSALQQSLGYSQLPETFSRLRLAEIVHVGKYRINPGADPRRRRLYFNYVRSLFSLRDEARNRYQHPWRHMELLKQDLQSTEAEVFNGAYAVSSYRSISNHNEVDEDPEKAASFSHFAACHGQHEYAIQELQSHGVNMIEEGKELSLLLSAAFGHRRFPPEAFAMLLRYYARSSLDKIKIKPSVRDDPLTVRAYWLSILMVFVSALVFGCLGEYRVKEGRNAKSVELKHIMNVFLLLDHVFAAIKEDREKGSFTSGTSHNDQLEFICILRFSSIPDRESDEAHMVSYTTLSQLALLYAPTQAKNLLYISGETSHNMSSDSMIDGADAHLRLPSWAASRLQSPPGNSLFITHDALNKYYCTQIISKTESVKAKDNLFFRIY